MQVSAQVSDGCGSGDPTTVVNLKEIWGYVVRKNKQLRDEIEATRARSGHMRMEQEVRITFR